MVSNLLIDNSLTYVAFKVRHFYIKQLTAKVIERRNKLRQMRVV